MNRIPMVITLVVAAVLAAGQAVASSWEAIDRLDSNTPVTLRVNGKPRAYFRVMAGQRLTVPIEGPARLRLTSRVEYEERKASTASYTLRVFDGTRELESQSTGTTPSGRTRGPGSAKVGKSRRMTVDVPDGRHDLQIAVEGPHTVLVRLHQAAPRMAHQTMVSLAPVETARNVLIKEGQRVVTYGSSMNGRPVRLRFMGPTTLEIVSRLEYDATMRGESTYRLVVREGDKVQRAVQFRTTKSSTASYTNVKGRVPSKFDRMRLPFGSGHHDVTVELEAPAGAVADIHPRIPQPLAGTGQ